MKVADLQQHLADLGRLLEAAKAPNVVADLAAIREGLAPFREYSLKDFASFLPRAEAFSRGEVPVVAPKRQRTGGSKTATTPKENPTELAREVAQLYEQASSPTVTKERLDAVAARLKPLKKDDLLRVAAGIELKVAKSKTIDFIIEAIHNRILQRKGTTQRAGLIDRPSASGADGPVPAADPRLAIP